MAARLLRLGRAAKLESELVVDAWDVIKETSSSDEIFKPDAVSARLFQIFDAEIYERLAEDQAREDPLSLIDFLTNVADQIDSASAHIAGEPVDEVRRSMRTMTKHFDCSNCGKRGMVCNGGIVDNNLFADPEGGRCLQFLVVMIESFAHAAEQYYRAVAGDSCPTTLIPSIILETYRNKKTCGTLPIDGEFQPPLIDAAAVLRIYWPIDKTLDQAILSLPYLVFHEVFVHGAQGSALPGPRFKVFDTCAFTEGAVDAVACDLLLKNVLSHPDNLPKELKELSADLYEACRDYHDKRFQYDADVTTAVLLEPGDKIRHARYLGRRQVYLLLREVQSICKRPDDWAERTILLLNLNLDKIQRREIFKLFGVARGRAATKLNLADPLDTFLVDRDADRLIKRLANLLTKKKCN